jgi:hypothetical protein
MKSRCPFINKVEVLVVFVSGLVSNGERGVVSVGIAYY